MDFKPASSLAEAFTCFRLVVHNYQQRGYLPQLTSVKGPFILTARFVVWLWEMFCFRVIGNGCVFVAKDGEKFLGTLTVFFNPRKIPLFRSEFRKICVGASQVAYIGSFATVESCKCTRTSARMIRAITGFLKERGTEIGLCIVHPDHVPPYRRYGFNEEAFRDVMPGLSGAPAVLIAVYKESVAI